MTTYNYPHLLIFLIIFALGGLCYIIYMVIKNEKEKKRYQETMEVGDMVYVASVRECTTTKNVIFRKFKSYLYPYKKSKNKKQKISKN